MKLKKQVIIIAQYTKHLRERVLYQQLVTRRILFFSSNCPHVSISLAVLYKLFLIHCTKKVYTLESAIDLRLAHTILQQLDCNALECNTSNVPSYESDVLLYVRTLDQSLLANMWGPKTKCLPKI